MPGYGKRNNREIQQTKRFFVIIEFYYSLCLFADLLNSARYNTTTTHSDKTTVRVYSMAKLFIL